MTAAKSSRMNEAQKRALEDAQDDVDIAYYAKKLRLKSKKEKAVSKEFYADGLGEILEFIETRDEKDYDQLAFDDEAPEEVSQREFQLFPKKLKDLKLKIPKIKPNQNQEEEEEGEEGGEEDDEDNNIDEEGDEDEEDEYEDNDEEESQSEFDEEYQSDTQTESNEPKPSASSTKWVSSRVQMKMRGLSLLDHNSKEEDLSYLDQDSDGDESNKSFQHPKMQDSKSGSVFKEDMYGRMVDEHGNVHKSDEPKSSTMTFEEVGAVDALNTKIRGLLNRLTIKTIPFVADQIEDLYKNHSNNLVARCLFNCINQLVVEHLLIASQKLCTELVMLVSVLHSHIGEEVSGNLLHNLILVFNENFEQLKSTGQTNGRKIENLLLLFCLFYSANMVGDELIYDLMNKFVDLFCPKSIEMMLFILKMVGYLLRKDNVCSMKEFIVKAQQKAAQFDKQAVTEMKVVFLLDSLTHIKNNNQLKMNLSDIQGVVAVDKQTFRNEIKALFKDLNVSPLSGNYKEILRSNRWFVQSGELLEQSIKRKNELRTERSIPTFNDKLCKKMQLTTPFRKLIFNALVSCEDYVDCSQNLIQIGKKKHFEVIGVCTHVALSEKQFNPFYVHLFRYLSIVDRNYKRGIMFVIRDKINGYDLLSERQQTNLALLTAELLRMQVIPMFLLKCIDFKDITDAYKTFLIRTLDQLFDASDNNTLSLLFKKLPKKDVFTISVKLFINMFLGQEHKTRLKQIKENHESLDKIF